LKRGNEKLFQDASRGKLPSIYAPPRQTPNLNQSPPNPSDSLSKNLPCSTMPTIADFSTAAFAGENGLTNPLAPSAVEFERSVELRSGKALTPQKRQLRSNSKAEANNLYNLPPLKKLSPPKRKSPRRSVNSTANSPSTVMAKEFGDKLSTSSGTRPNKSSDELFAKLKWNPGDVEQMRVVKEALHVSTLPSGMVCREDEHKKVLEFCKLYVEQERSGSLYVCGCPGTGKTMVMEKVKHSVADWAKQADLEEPDVLSVNCTSLTNTSEVFVKILQKIQPRKKINSSNAALKQIQDLYSRGATSPSRMMLLIIDELDYLITKDRAVLHELFMLTTLPYSRCILIGIANAIDLADRFLPKLQSLNCKPTVFTFRAYSKDQILTILRDRLQVLPSQVFQPQALELCARKVAAASGDMRRALCVCRSAIEMLEAEIKENASQGNLLSSDGKSLEQQNFQASTETETNVQVHHMALALSKAYRSPVVETIQSLPQHQQIILCSAVKLFRTGKKDSSVGELNRSYGDLCKLMLIPPVGIMELSSMCRVLNDQGLLKTGHSHKVEKVSLKIDAADITFALQGVRFFRNCLQ
ncbi:hypothetical protein V2J09_011854, partial [Rumex salicifolius]